MYKNNRIAVVMPIHNEEKLAAGAISRIPRWVDWIIAVEDGSLDKSWAVLNALEDRRIIALRHSINRGVGAATKTGYREALARGAHLIAVMDGDGQMDARDLHPMLDAAIQGADYVKGNRFLNQSIATMPLQRYLGNRIFSWLTSRLAALDSIVDAQCGYTVIRRAALQQIDLDRMYDRYGFLNDMVFAAAQLGQTIRSVPVRTIYANEVSGINPLVVVPTILSRILVHSIRQRLSCVLGFFSVVQPSEGRGE